MELATKDPTLEVKNMAEANLSGQTVLSSKETSMITILKATGLTPGQMEGSSLGVERRIRWKGRVDSPGLMAGFTLVTISMIKSMARGSSDGLINEAMTVNGRTGSSMGKGSMLGRVGN